jgi:ribokinase
MASHLSAGGILVVGSLNMDLVVRAPRHPRVGETILGTAFHTFPGGKGANQAVAAARLGSNVCMIGRVGSDAFGDEMAAIVEREGIDTTFLLRDPDKPTGVALITVDDAGQNNIVVVPGANGCLSPDDIRSARPAFANASLLLLQLEIPLETVRQAVAAAHEHGMQVILNPAPARELDPELLASIDYLVPNQHELELLTGSPSVQDGVEKLRSSGVNRVIVTLGEEGAYTADESGEQYIPAFSVEAVDTTAAGDAFMGGFAAGILRGLTPARAAVWGSAAGALAVTRQGALPSLPTREEFDNFLAIRHVL